MRRGRRVEVGPGALQVVVGGGNSEKANQNDRKLGIIFQRVPPGMEGGLGVWELEDAALGHGAAHPQGKGLWVGKSKH